MTWREDLRAIIDEVALSEIPEVLGELARGQAVAQLRLQAPRQNGGALAPISYLRRTKSPAGSASRRNGSTVTPISSGPCTCPPAQSASLNVRSSDTSRPARNST